MNINGFPFITLATVHFSSLKKTRNQLSSLGIVHCFLSLVYCLLIVPKYRILHWNAANSIELNFYFMLVHSREWWRRATWLNCIIFCEHGAPLENLFDWLFMLLAIYGLLRLETLPNRDQEWTIHISTHHLP